MQSLSAECVFTRPAIFESFLKLLLLPRALPQSGADGEEEVTVLDLEETGYQASFSKLGASEPPRRDPVADISDLGVFMARSLVECSQAHPGQVCLLFSVYTTFLADVRLPLSDPTFDASSAAGVIVSLYDHSRK